jgi:diguanylate cyclase (GGDEF)-like protein
VRLALRLVAVGIVVLASLLYAGGVQIGTRNAEIASYSIGETAVRLVERLDDLSALLGGYHVGEASGANRAVAQTIAEMLASFDKDAIAGGLSEDVPESQIERLQGDWTAAERRPADATLVRLTNETMHESYLRVGTIAIMRGSETDADAVLAEASLQAVPAANAQFARITALLLMADPKGGSDQLPRAGLAAMYADASSTANVALEPRWFAGLPPDVRAQADAARTGTGAFLELFRIHIVRGDALTRRAQLLASARIASGKLALLEASLLPLIRQRLADAQERARREIALIVGLMAAIIAVVALLSFQVLRSQLRSRRARTAFQHQATHDALTGMPNRRAFVQAASKAVAAWTPVNDRTSWILSIDFDNFKEVNDRYGHQAGDDFLVAASQRLHGATPLGDLVARVGGDEFAVLVHHYDPDSAHAVGVGEAICEAFEEPIRIEGVEHRLAASIGIVAVDALHETVDSILRDADIAMYRAKEEGGDRVVVFDDVLRAEIIDRAELASDLRDALARNTGVRVVFQPIIALDDRTCHGFEALVRWKHPVRGEIDASYLVDIAQEARLIDQLGRRVVHEVCRHLSEWRAAGLEIENMSVHFNVSPMEAAHAGTYASIADAMETWNIPPQSLVIEMTETASVESIETAGRFLGNLNAMGVRVCLDDFGTGYSSLRHLNDFQVDAIKIDRSFVISAANDPAKIPIVAGIIALARGLNAEVIAEGIETPEQREMIADLGCRLVQGYLFGRPMPADDAFRFAQRTLASPVKAP